MPHPVIVPMKLPKISPLTPARRRKPFDHPDWIFELKQDGFRRKAYIAEGKSKLFHVPMTYFKVLVCFERHWQICPWKMQLSIIGLVFGDKLRK